MSYDPAFQSAVARVLTHEGGYVNNPHDKGGETNFGICKRNYPALDIKHLTREKAVDIYYHDYWQKLPAGLPVALAPDMLDAAVNSGPKQAVIFLQRAMGGGPADGTWGDFDAKALAGWAGRETLLAVRLNAIRLAFMSRLMNWDDFGSGWAQRIAGNLLALS